MTKANNEMKAYCKGKMVALIRDHNHYKKVKYTAAVKDYRTAIEVLVGFAARQGIKIGYTEDEKGYLAIV